MPTYEYACQSCGRHVEVFQKFSEDPLTTCEVCGGALRKVFHPAGILFKGSGFYATDYGSRKRSRELMEAGEGKGKHAKDEVSSNSDWKTSSSASKGSSSDSKGSSTSESSSESTTSSSTKSGSAD